MTMVEEGEAGLPGRSDRTLLALAGRLRGLKGTQVAPAIAPDPLMAALDSYLELRDDETLLAIVRAGKDDPPRTGCTLTTRRIHWAGKPVATDDNLGLLDADRGSRPRLRRSLPYRELAARIGRSGGLAKSVEFGPGCRISLGYEERAQEALILFLHEARALAVGEGPPPEVAAEARAEAEQDWPAVVEADDAAKSAQADRRAIRLRITRASRALVTPILVASCVAVYLAMMVVVGGEGGVPTNEAMVGWGAVFGPSIVLDGEAWRLFTAMFLHFGPVHLLMNLWCLIGNGPTVERFFGHWAFAAIYVLSGAGASIASLWAHPTYVCAGASGAIFGVLGALLGFVVVQRRQVPAAMLRPLHSGAGAFLFYNLIFGLADPKIDKAAHLGGLATGFIAGLLLTPRGPAAGRSRSIRRPALAATMAAGLGLLAWVEMGHARAQIEADPAVGRAVIANRAALTAWNDFHAAVEPVAGEFEAIEGTLDRVTKEIDAGNAPADRVVKTLRGLSDRLDALGPRVAALPAANPEIAAMRDRLGAARQEFLASIKALKRFVASPSPATGEAFTDSTGRYTKDFQDFAALREAYFKAHDLRPKPD